MDPVLPSLTAALSSYQEKLPLQKQLPLPKSSRCYSGFLVLSYMLTCTVEEVASSCNAVQFFQIYVYKRRDATALLAQRVERCSYKAIVLTVNTPKLGRRESDMKNKLIVSQPENFEGLLSMKVSPVTRMRSRMHYNSLEGRSYVDWQHEVKAGVNKVIKMLKDKLELTIALSGCSTIKDIITRRNITTEHD